MTGNPAFEALAGFSVQGGQARLERVGEGLIHETYRVLLDGAPAYILQRLNTGVFPEPPLLMRNLLRALPHLQGPGYTPLKIARTPGGAALLEDGDGQYWRLFHYIPGSTTLEHTADPVVAREAGRILGRFHQLAGGIPAEELEVPLPRFHDLAWRAGQLEQAVKEGLPDRLQPCGDLISLARDLIGYCRQIPLEKLPTRVCHNDPKLGNILFEKTTGKALCLIDLDTLMPGSLLYDFGDAARTLLSPVPESDTNPGKIEADLRMFEALVAGLKESGCPLAGEERAWLPFGVVLMPTLHGVRALADHFVGDPYYQTYFEGQNRVRARNLLTFARVARETVPEMTGILENVLG